MQLSRIRPLLTVGAAVLLVAGAASSASAARPVISTLQLSFIDHAIASCGDFDILASGVFTFRITTFFDPQTGIAIRTQTHVMVTATLTNSLTGRSVSDSPDPQLIVRDLEDGTLAAHGLFFRVTVPGEGEVLVDAGTYIVNADGSVTLRGPRVQQEGSEEVCAALQ